MDCPNCHTRCGEEDRFCFRCGSALSAAPAEKKGSHAVPILILILMSVIGIGIYLATQHRAPVSVGNDTTLSDMPWFQVDEGYVWFDETLYTGGSEILIPDQIGGETVYGLSEGCFENCTKITTVILPETLEEIGSFAFTGCTSLRGVYIPENVSVIGASAFSGCESLEAVTVPSSVRFIGSWAFEGCYELRHIFFDGSYSTWAELYDEFIGLETVVYCEDGSFYHSMMPSIP